MQRPVSRSVSVSGCQTRAEVIRPIDRHYRYVRIVRPSRQRMVVLNSRVSGAERLPGSREPNGLGRSSRV
jgi:hypothetical protein